MARLANPGMALMPLAGCAPPAVAPPVNEARVAVGQGDIAPLIDADARTYHFGAIIAHPGRNLDTSTD